MLFIGIKSSRTILGSHEWHFEKLKNFASTFWKKPTFNSIKVWRTSHFFRNSSTFVFLKSDFTWIQSLFWLDLIRVLLSFLLFQFVLFKHLEMSENSKIAKTLVSRVSLLEDFLQAHFFRSSYEQLMKSILATLSHLSAPRNYNGAINCLHSHFNISTPATLCVSYFIYILMRSQERPWNSMKYPTVNLY